MMGSTSVTTNDLSLLSGLIDIISDPTKTKAVIADLDARVQAVKDAEDSVAKETTALDVRAKDLDDQEFQFTKKEASQGLQQKDLDNRTSIVVMREQAVADIKTSLDQQLQSLQIAQTQLADTKAKFEVDAVSRLSDIQVAFNKKTVELQIREDAVSKREQDIADAQADLDVWKVKVAAAAALVAAVGKS